MCRRLTTCVFMEWHTTSSHSTSNKSNSTSTSENKNGYTTHKVPFYVGEEFIESDIYIGTIDNEAFVGPESLEDTAHVIRTAVGPSGKNIDYLANLVHSIKDFGIRDHYLEHLYTLASSNPDSSTLPTLKPAPTD